MYVQKTNADRSNISSVDKENLVPLNKWRYGQLQGRHVVYRPDQL